MTQHAPYLPLLLVASLASPAAAQSEAVLRDNIVVVLDASGSMNQRMGGVTRMAAAKKALLKVMQQVPNNTQVGLLVFSSSNLSNDWVYPLGPLDRRKLEAAINAPLAGGGTPLGAYLKKGAEALLQQREKQRGFGTYRLLIVTDGEASDPELVSAYLPDLLTRGLTLDVIGVDMHANHSLATHVHAYRRANSPDDLVKAVAEAFAEVGPAQDAALHEDVFAALEGLPDEVARVMLHAVTSPSNEPIGTRTPHLALDDGSGRSGGRPAQYQRPGSKFWGVTIVVLVVAVGVLSWLARRYQSLQGGRKA